VLSLDRQHLDALRILFSEVSPKSPRSYPPIAALRQIDEDVVVVRVEFVELLDLAGIQPAD